ncbi:NADP-dependent oxidoreductase [Methylobacterium gnaphalii]|uniref:NADPH:quinone oxidoreductase n=1 Tax=Methylobacterium gnaphalii TaxID=1010610 RepID=A0A512JRX3_9HYPH|nr:NADP-dependent oxidoreductase [Methylobacterium gnaphalii]GEP12700.1 NADPH:quinone oxidoreductase [Methylobacterium gnaphalii]GJD70890.1 Narbonolide/10-deoxymethynolide synthase PikA2, modules 3 and 4 [Methylobacterium gnaphalii]GLS50944.1 NADPH:quinone oxidoreductase [Methylobacterium gnaphalii]
MKAFAIDGYKSKDGLVARELFVPEPGDKDVLVEIHAASVNPLDAKLAEGAFKAFLPYKMPLILGHDLAGVVVRVGAGARRFAVGDEVYGRVADGRIGTFAEFIAVNEDDLAPKPKTLTMTEAAAVPLVALTAWQALVERAGLKCGQKVLIQAGSGGVGTIAIQLAKHLGAVVATTTGTANVDLVKGLGADIIVDYRKDDFAKILRDCDVVFDTQGGKTLDKSVNVLKPGGQIIGIAGPPDPRFAEQAGLAWPLKLVFRLLSGGIRRKAKRHGGSYGFLFMRASGDQLRQITALVDAGSIRPVIDRVFPFAATREALDYVATGRAKGKVVVAVK